MSLTRLALRRADVLGDVLVLSGSETRPSILQYERLEAQSWAPWLRFSRQVLAEQVRAFPEEQLFAFDGGVMVGALSANRISWDGDPATLATWDAIAGVGQDYTDTHDRNGNTLVLMSMSIARRSRASGIASRLLSAARASARDRGITHVIGDFRPSGYGGFKDQDPRDFLSYVDLHDPEGRPVDPWLRAVSRVGMRRLKVDERAMVVTVDLETFEALRRDASPLDWVRTDRARDARLHEPALSFPLEDCEFWESGQTGTWYVHRRAGRATYVESGLWGVLVTDGSEG